MTDDENVSSVEQDSWKELATAIRVEIRQVVQTGVIRRMNPGELQSFMAAVTQAYDLDWRAERWDETQRAWTEMQ